MFYGQDHGGRSREIGGEESIESGGDWEREDGGNGGSQEYETFQYGVG